MAWLRLYDDILDDPKIQLLSDRAFRMLINLWCLAKRNGGLITDNPASLSFSLRWPLGKVKDTLQALISAGLIERVEGGYEPHNWHGRQYASDGHDATSAERMRRYRARNPTRNKSSALRESDASHTVTSDASVTVLEQRQSTEQNRTEQITKKEPRTKVARSLKSKLPPDFFPDLEAATNYWLGKNRPDLVERAAEIAAAFRDHHTAHGTASASWECSWRTWYGNSLKFERVYANGQNGFGRQSAYQQLSEVGREICDAIDGQGGGGSDHNPKPQLPHNTNGQGRTGEVVIDLLPRPRRAESG